jgi:hypothetical protein
MVKVKIGLINVLHPSIQKQKLPRENFLPSINFLQIQNPSYLTLEITSKPSTYEKTSPTPFTNVARSWASAACTEKSSCKS